MTARHLQALVWNASVDYVEVTEPDKDKDKRMYCCAVIVACHLQVAHLRPTLPQLVGPAGGRPQ